MKFLILNFFIKALLNATYEINPIDYSHKTVAHYNTYHTSITEWSILKPLITVLRTWYILPVHYISVQYSHSNSTPYMDTPNCPVMVIDTELFVNFLLMQVTLLESREACEIKLTKPLKFLTGRVDCVSDDPEGRAYVTTKPEVRMKHSGLSTSCDPGSQQDVWGCQACDWLW